MNGVAVPVSRLREASIQKREGIDDAAKTQHERVHHAMGRLAQLVEHLVYTATV
jgi:hypothetical protein